MLDETPQKLSVEVEGSLEAVISLTQILNRPNNLNRLVFCHELISVESLKHMVSC